MASSAESFAISCCDDFHSGHWDMALHFLPPLRTVDIGDISQLLLVAIWHGLENVFDPNVYHTAAAWACQGLDFWPFPARFFERSPSGFPFLRCSLGNSQRSAFCVKFPLLEKKMMPRVGTACPNSKACCTISPWSRPAAPAAAKRFILT